MKRPPRKQCHVQETKFLAPNLRKRRCLRHETAKNGTKKTQDYRLKFQLDRLQSSIKLNKHHFLRFLPEYLAGLR